MDVLDLLHCEFDCHLSNSGEGQNTSCALCDLTPLLCPVVRRKAWKEKPQEIPVDSPA